MADLVCPYDLTNPGDALSTVKNGAGGLFGFVGRYQLVQRLGQGGMGTVYEAHDPQLDRKVALKIVRPDVAELGGVERLVREGRALARLSHPNVVAVHDAGVDRDRVYVIMELVEGRNLATWLRMQPRDLTEIVRMFVAAARGIAAAHRAGVIHRDVKPENILVDQQGVAKVADFGLAGHLSICDSDERLTLPNAIMGTPAFMSPEQRRGEVTGPATDQYSLCAALRRALFDDRPSRKLPAWLEEALTRGLAESASSRFPSMDDLVVALDVDARRRRARRSRFTLFMAGVAGVAALGAFGIGRAAEADADPTLAACAIARDERAAMWNQDTQDAVARTLLATDRALGIELVSRVRRLGDRYTSALAIVEAQTCAQTPRTDSARAIANESLACMKERRDAFTAAVTALRTPGVDTKRAIPVLQRLVPVEDCGNPAVLAENLAAGATPLGAATKAQIEQFVEDASTQEKLADFDGATAKARQAVALARPGGGVLLARSLITLGRLRLQIGASEDADASFREAITVAERAGADHVRAVALVNQVNALARISGREKEALALVPMVQAAIERTDKSLELVLRDAAGIAKFHLKQVDAALVEFQAALALARTWFAPDDPKLVHYLHTVALTLGNLSRFEEAQAAYLEARTISIAANGADHPETARVRIHELSQIAYLGSCEPTLDEFAQLRRILTGVLPADSVELVQISNIIAICHWRAKRYDDAEREVRTRQDALVAGGRAKSDAMISSWGDLGDLAVARKQTKLALEHYQRALRETEELVGVTDSRVVTPLERLGTVELEAGRPAAAIPWLERALTIYTANKGPAVDVAQLELGLSRALWRSKVDRRRALALADTARAAFVAAGPAHAALRTDAETWLHEISR